MAHQTSDEATTTTTFFIPNLHCPSCVTSIEGSLASLQPPPISTSHSIISHSITVRHHDADLPVPALTTALEQAGFEVYSVVQGKRPSVTSGSWQEQQQKQPARPLSPSDWGGLEAAISRWRLGRRERDVDSAERRKRKRHMEQCKQCQREMLTTSSSSTGSLIDEEKKSVPAVSDKEDLSSLHENLDLSPVVVVDAQEARTFQADFAISGMTCSACVGNISTVISQNSWVQDVNVSVLNNSATVTFRGEGNETRVVESVSDAGYDITLEGVREVRVPKKQQTSRPNKGDGSWRAGYTIGGMTCSACVGAINNALKEPSWIESVDVNLISNSATVVYHGRKDRATTIKDMIEDIGYDASIEDMEELGAEKPAQDERSVIIRVEGMYCHHCPARILQTLKERYSDSIHIDSPPSQAQPLLRITYKPRVPTFTLRHIVTTIKAVDSELQPSIYHAPTIEQRSQEIHSKERRRILLRLALSVIVAVPTFIIGIVYMTLVHASNPGRQYLMQPIWGGRVSRAEWALFILSTIIYFFATDLFHLRTLAGVKAMWRRGSPVPLLDRFYRFGSMNMLITIGTSIAYFASIAALAINARDNHNNRGSGMEGDDQDTSTSYYFDSVVFLTMFLLVGRFLEAYSKARTGDAVASLGLLRPSEALLVPPTEAEAEDHRIDNDPAPQPATPEEGEKVPIDLLEVGDVVRVPHGSSPPFDGLVLDGTTKFDESSLTGESRLVSKNSNDPVFSGTINRGNPVTVRLTSLSGTSMLDQIIRVVREGQMRRAPVERVADVVTSHFVPFIVVVGVLTWIIWLGLGLSGRLPGDYLDTTSTTTTGGWAFWSLQFSIAVFVIACPCGIGLAAPTALFVGGGIAAKNGILVKGGGEAFQEASMLDCVVFDKTGTLTRGGQPAVMEHMIVGGGDSGVVVSIARALEENSSHPIAASIVGFCTSHEARAAKSHDVEEIPGKGLKGVVELLGNEQVTAIIGNEGLMEDYSVAIDTATTDTLDEWKRQGMSVALKATKASTSKAYTLSAIFAISDPIRPEAASVIRTLQARDLSVWLLSGDNKTTANTVGAAVGIPSSNVIAGVLPEQKADKIKYLQRTLSSRRRSSNKSRSSASWFSQRAENSRAIVAMVGDGINDAPALATADVGIAIGSGSDVALSTASFVLVTSDLHALVTLITLSRKVFRRVRLNFAWALVYNMVALPIAAGVLYPVVSGGKHVRLDPVWASLAMALSSVSVVMSSLGLRTRIPGVGFRPARQG